jgi:hypothetical protein
MRRPIMPELWEKLPHRTARGLELSTFIFENRHEEFCRKSAMEFEIDFVGFLR